MVFASQPKPLVGSVPGLAAAGGADRAAPASAPDLVTSVVPGWPTAEVPPSTADWPRALDAAPDSVEAPPRSPVPFDNPEEPDAVPVTCTVLPQAVARLTRSTAHTRAP